MDTSTNMPPPVTDTHEFPPGTVERRIIAFYLDGIKRKLYDWGSLRLGRDTAEGMTFKEEIRKVFYNIRRTCYDLVNSELQESGDTKLTAAAIVSIVNYAITTTDSDNVAGPLWTQITSLVNFTFGQASRSVLNFIEPRIRDFIVARTAHIRDDFDEEWSGAIDYLVRNVMRTDTDD